MTWTKLSDDFTDDTWVLSDAAVRLHVDALVWSNRKLLDLRIPKDDLARISKAPSESVTELVDGSWWSDEGDHYLIQHHGMYQRTREQVIAQQQANRRNGRRGGRPGRERRESKTPLETQSVNEPQSELVSDSKTERDGTGQDWKGSTRGDDNVNGGAVENCAECQRTSAFGTVCVFHSAVAS